LLDWPAMLIVKRESSKTKRVNAKTHTRRQQAHCGFRQLAKTPTVNYFREWQ
jgi:hypothetical protein